MGMQRIDYLFWGAKLDLKSFNGDLRDKYEKEMYEEEGRLFDIVYDGMSGKYAIAGKIIQKTLGHEDAGFEFTEVDEAIMNLDKHNISRKVFMEFPDCGKFRTYLFSHWK